MGKDDYDPKLLPQTPPRPVTPIQSPTWSPISPLPDSAPPSTPNHNLLGNILLQTGIYNPRRDALKPTALPPWERSTSSKNATFASDDAQQGSVLPKPNTQNKVRRAPRKSAGTAPKAAHLVWIEDEGLPNLKAKLDENKQQLDSTLQDIASLDLQIRAIRIMKSKKEFKEACEQHVETKLNLNVKKVTIRKEIQKIQRALTTMLRTQQTLRLEIEREGKVRKSIQNSTCLLYTSPSPRD